MARRRRDLPTSRVVDITPGLLPILLTVLTYARAPSSSPAITFLPPPSSSSSSSSDSPLWHRHHRVLLILLLSWSSLPASRALHPPPLPPAWSTHSSLRVVCNLHSFLLLAFPSTAFIPTFPLSQKLLCPSFPPYLLVNSPLSSRMLSFSLRNHLTPTLSSLLLPPPPPLPLALPLLLFTPGPSYAFFAHVDQCVHRC